MSYWKGSTFYCHKRGSPTRKGEWNRESWSYDYLRSCFVPRYTRRLNDVSLNKKHLAVFVYGSTYGRRLAIPVSRQASSVKLPAQSCCASSANHLSFSSFVALLFFFSSVLLSIRGCLQSHISAWYTYMHTSAYLYICTHSPISSRDLW